MTKNHCELIYDHTPSCELLAVCVYCTVNVANIISESVVR